MTTLCWIAVGVLAVAWGIREYFWREYRNRHKRDKKVVL